jgi:hypothetical protein
MKDRYKVVLITACGKKKETKPGPAWRLYRSPRIRYLKKKADKFQIDFYILSSKYGLIHSDEIIEPYESVITRERCKILLPEIIKKLTNIQPHKVVFYKGGARKEYFECVEEACRKLNKPILSFGYANMGGIKKLDEILGELS